MNMHHQMHQQMHHPMQGQALKRPLTFGGYMLHCNPCSGYNNKCLKKIDYDTIYPETGAPKMTQCRKCMQEFATIPVYTDD